MEFLQEHRAPNALKALKQRLAGEIIALRGGECKTVPVRDVVPGDVMKLKIGNIVSADVKLLLGDYLLIDQAALIGESLPVSKKINDVACANTVVKQGKMLAAVVSTGMRTNFSSVVSLVARASLKEHSHVQKMVIQIGSFLILITLALVLLMVMGSLFRREPLLEKARFALVLTLAAIPVALPAVLSVTMAHWLGVCIVDLALRPSVVCDQRRDESHHLPHVAARGVLA